MTSSGESFRLQAQSQNPHDLFEDVARQVSRLFIEPELVGHALREKVAIEGETLEQLLREWVTTLLDLIRGQNLLFTQVRLTRLETPASGPYVLQAELLGELRDPHRHPLKHDPAWLKYRQGGLRKTGHTYLAEVEIG
jgi:SHS2 domain-containing protein